MNGCGRLFQFFIWFWVDIFNSGFLIMTHIETFRRTERVSIRFAEDALPGKRRGASEPGQLHSALSPRDLYGRVGLCGGTQRKPGG